MQYSQEHLKTMVYAEFGGQTECIMGNSKIENCHYIVLHRRLCYICVSNGDFQIGFGQNWATVYKRASLVGKMLGENKDGKKWAFMYIL